MNEIIFYWSSWLCWIWATWIMEKNIYRTQVAIFTLIAIICSSFTISIFQYTINLAIIFFLCMPIYLLCKKNIIKQFYLMFISIVIALGYAAIYLFSIYDPIIAVLPLNVLTTLYFLVNTYFVASQFIEKLAIIFFATTFGEILIGIILSDLNLYHEIGMNQYLTRISLSFLALVVFTSTRTIIHSFERFVLKHKKEGEKV